MDRNITAHLQDKSICHYYILHYACDPDFGLHFKNTVKLVGVLTIESHLEDIIIYCT